MQQAERGSRPTRRHPCDDPREDIGAGVVECGLNRAFGKLLATYYDRRF